MMIILAELYDADGKPRQKLRPKAEALRLFYAILDDNGDGNVTREELVAT